MIYLIIAYAVVGIIFGYIMARMAYNEPAKRGSLTGTFRGALTIWLLHGAIWPLLVLLFSLGFFFEWLDNRPSGGHTSLGDRIFGGKS